MIMKRFAALEEQQYFDNGVNIELFDPTGTGDALLEASDTSIELNQHLSEITEAEQTLPVLDDITTRLEVVQHDGGLSQPIAQALTAAVEHFAQRLGSRRTFIPSVALEGFDSRTDKPKTQMVLEGIKELGRSVWEAIKRAFAVAIEWIAKFFKSIFGGKEALKKKAEAVKKETEDLRRAHNDEALKQACAAFYQTATEEAADLFEKTETLGDHEEINSFKVDLKPKERKPESAKEKEQAVVKIVKRFVQDRKLANYFRKNEKECFSAQEIETLFVNCRESYSQFLGTEHGNTLPQMAKLLQETTNRLRGWKVGERLLDGGVDIGEDYVRRIMGVISTGKGITQKSFFDGGSYVDSAIYDMFRVELAFDSDLCVFALKKAITPTQENITEQFSSLAKRPDLKADDARLEVALPSMSKKVQQASDDMLRVNLTSHIKRVTDALAELLNEGEKIKVKLEVLPEEEGKPLLRRLQLLLMIVQSATVKAMAISNQIAQYELKMIGVIAEYVHQSNVVLKGIADIQSGK